MVFSFVENMLNLCRKKCFFVFVLLRVWWKFNLKGSGVAEGSGKC